MSTPSTRLQIRRPLVSIETIRCLTNKSEDQVIELIEKGDLRFAWNVAALEKGRRCVRVLTLSVADLVNGTHSQPSEHDDAIKYLLPASSETIRASTVARVFNVSGTHVAGLVDRGCLVKVRDGTKPKDTPLLSRASAVKFLTLRRLP